VETTRLATLQRRLWRLLTAPEGVAELLAAEGDAEGRSLAGWLASDAILPAARRLDVYANAYFFRIHDCLKEDYAALHAALGDDGFHDLVTAYLMVHPSRHPSLRFAGAALAGFLAADPAAEPFRSRWPWASDLARLDWALVDAFDAPDARPLRREDLTRIPAAHWPDLRLRLQPSVRLLRLAWPVAALREARERDRPLSEPDAASDTAVCTWRRAERVHFRTLTPPEADLLEAARDEASFGQLCQRAESALGAAAAPAFAARCLSRWLRDELLAGQGGSARRGPALDLKCT
jgi:hypothetical protein